MTVDEYWSWWEQARGDVAAAMDANEPQAPALVDMMDRIYALGLGCETAPGQSARYAICVTPEGDPVRRKLAYRWRDAAPPADAVFEYHPARIAAPRAEHFALQIGPHEIAFSDLRFAIAADEERHELDLEVQHPAFSSLDEQDRMQIGYLALDSILGEEEVERWIGELEFSGDAPTAADGPAELRAHVERLRATTARDQWALFRGHRADGTPFVGMVARPLRPVDHPYFDALCELKALVPDDALAPLQDNEDALHAEFAGRAFHALSVTEGGERTAFAYVDQDTSVPAELKAWATDRGYAVDISEDPGWDAIRAFR